MKVKYLGIYINSRTNNVDPSAALALAFISSFNNIMSVLGYNRDKLLAVHLLETYCLPVLLYGCEIWQILALTNIKSMLPWITVLGKFLMPVGVKVPNRFYFSAILTMPVSLLVDQRIFFYKKQPPVAILFWVPCANYIIMTYRNWHPLIQYPVWMLESPTLKWPFGAILPRHLLCNFYL